MSETIRTADGLSLESVVDEPARPHGTIVLCHPHPLHGGTMRAPLLLAIARHAVDVGLRAIRFNFRGVGASEGAFGDGVDELADVSAAMESAAGFREPVVGLCGWSFGAATALRWQAHTGSITPYVGIAPPVTGPLTPSLPDAIELEASRRRFIVGERDQFIEPDELSSYAASVDADFIQYRGTDHFFVFRYDRLAADTVAMFEM